MNMKNTSKSSKHSPVTYLKALVPIQLPWRLASTHAPLSQTRKCQYAPQQTTMNTTRPLSKMALPMEPLVTSNAYLTASYVPV